MFGLALCLLYMYYAVMQIKSCMFLYFVHLYNGSESMYGDGVWSVCMSVSMPQYFCHAGTCGQLLSPQFFV